MIDHVSTERLSEYVDGVLAHADAVALERHMRGCDTCARDLTRVRGLLAAARSLPRDIEPPPALWHSLRETLESRKIASLPSPKPAASTSRSRWFVWAAAASIVVVAATGLVLSRLTPERPSAVRSYTVSSRTSAVVAAMIERHYMPALNQLTASLRDAQASHKPIPAVDRSLVIVDAAIAETRAALDRDPGNRDIADLLAANYQRKLDLLKRASELTSEQ
jgi:anti-sigma-K factor RskA